MNTEGDTGIVSECAYTFRLHSYSVVARVIAKPIAIASLITDFTEKLLLKVILSLNMALTFQSEARPPLSDACITYFHKHNTKRVQLCQSQFKRTLLLRCI